MEQAARELMKDRHTLDAIARAVVTGERGLGDVEDRIADDVASIMIHRLQAVGAPGPSRVAHLDGNDVSRWERVERSCGRELLDLLIRRTDKHLAYAAMIRLNHGDP